MWAGPGSCFSCFSWSSSTGSCLGPGFRRDERDLGLGSGWGRELDSARLGPVTEGGAALGAHAGGDLADEGGEGDGFQGGAVEGVGGVEGAGDGAGLAGWVVAGAGAALADVLAAEGRPGA